MVLLDFVLNEILPRCIINCNTYNNLFDDEGKIYQNKKKSRGEY